MGMDVLKHLVVDSLEELCLRDISLLKYAVNERCICGALSQIMYKDIQEKYSE